MFGQSDRCRRLEGEYVAKTIHCGGEDGLAAADDGEGGERDGVGAGVGICEVTAVVKQGEGVSRDPVDGGSPAKEARYRKVPGTVVDRIIRSGLDRHMNGVDERPAGRLQNVDGSDRRRGQGILDGIEVGPVRGDVAKTPAASARWDCLDGRRAGGQRRRCVDLQWAHKRCQSDEPGRGFRRRHGIGRARWTCR